MQILNNLIIIGLVALSFFAGMHVSDRYYDEERRQVEYQIRLAQARIRSKDYSAYVAPPKRRMPIGQPFLDRLKKNGRATQQINKSKEIS